MSLVTFVRGLVALAAGISVGCSSGSSPPARLDAASPHDARDAGQSDALSAEAAADAPSTPDARDDARDAGHADAPTATTLAVSPLTLVPPFDPAIHDYYVRCVAGDNELTVSMTAAPGSAIALSQPRVTAPGVDETQKVSLAEGAAVVANVTTGAAVGEYWVRCLPHDFPQVLMTPHADAGAPTPGYYLMGDVIQAQGEGGYAMAVDTNGVPVWYHTTKTGQGAVNVDLLKPGVISFVPNLDLTYASVSGQIELHALAERTTGYLETVDMPLDMHELRLLKNGHYLAFSDPIVSGIDLTGLQSFGPEEDMLGCVIQELTSTGEKVWEWDIRDHFDAVKDSTWPQTYPVDGKTVVDPFHCNSIDVDPSTDDLLVSARHMDSVFRISGRAPKGEVLWKLGGQKFVKDVGAKYIAVVNDPMIAFHRQHDVRLLSDGNVTMFDDQTETAGPARAVVYSLDLATATASVVWQYKGTTTSLAMGSFRVQPDGARVIGWGVGWGVLGPNNRAFSEVDQNDRDLLDFGFPDGDATYRAIKVATTEIDIGLLRKSAGAD